MREIANSLPPHYVRIAALGLALAACQTGDDVSTASESTQLRSAPLSECITIAPTDDAMISNPPKSQNFGNNPLLRVGGKDESLLRFDLSGLPAETQIDSATLRLYVNGAGGDTPVNVHRATAAWAEASVTYQNFNQQFDATIEGAFLPGSPNALKSVSLTGLVSAWFSGAHPNYGVLLEASGNKKTIFISSENPNTQYQPSLEVCYTLPTEDACDPDPCQNGGLCANADDGYTCACPAGYTGVDCEIDIDECGSEPCQNGSECIDEIDGYSCACAPGYTGEHCEIDIDECDSSPCQNGICTDLIDAYECECDPGFTGANCEIDIDECQSSPCQNVSDCVDGINGYSCECAPGFTGEHCEIDIDECASGECQNDATCVDGIDDYECACLPGFTGEHCETNIDECDAAPCLNGGACQDGVDDYECACAPGYTGDNCEIDIDECMSEPCANGGLCIDGVDGYTCECTPGWSGTNCELEDVATCPCVDQRPDLWHDISTLGPGIADCEGGNIGNPMGPFADAGAGSGEGYDGTFFCMLLSPVSWEMIQLQTTEANANVCKQYIADACATNTCAANPCAEGETCVSSPFTSYGYTCESPCDADPCQNGGICTEAEGSYTCECPVGTSGPNCEVTCPCVTGATQNGDTLTSEVWNAALAGEAVAESCQSDGGGTTYVSTGNGYGDALVVTPDYCRATNDTKPGYLYMTNELEAAACESITDHVSTAANLTCDAVDACPCAGGTYWNAGWDTCLFSPRVDDYFFDSQISLGGQINEITNGETPTVISGPGYAYCWSPLDGDGADLTPTQYHSCFDSLLDADTNGACTNCMAQQQQQQCVNQSSCYSDTYGMQQCT